MNTCPYDTDKMRRLAEEKLGWRPGESRVFSFNALKELLPVGSKLRHEFEVCLRTGSHIYQPR